MRTSMIITEQVRAPITVPAGTFEAAIKVVARGPVTGFMGNIPIQSGSILQTTWLVPGVGFVREDRILDLKLAAPGGVEAQAYEESSKVLESYSPREARRSTRRCS